MSISARLGLACLGLSLLSPVAHAELVSQTLNFEDLQTTSVGTPMPANYHGFTWDTAWHGMAATGPTPNDYLAMSSGSSVIRSTDGTDFYFDGADFWSRRGLDPNGLFYFVLYHDGVTVYYGKAESDEIDFNATPTLLNADAFYTGPVDGVALAFKGPAGNNLNGNDDWTHLAMDNFRFRAEAGSSLLGTAAAAATVPEPTSLALVALSMLRLAGSRRARQARPA